MAPDELVDFKPIRRSWDRALAYQPLSTPAGCQRYAVWRRLCIHRDVRTMLLLRLLLSRASGRRNRLTGT